MSISILQCVHVVLVSALCIHAAKSAAPQLKLIDYPGGRKVHVGNVPVVGGLAIFVAFADALYISQRIAPDYWLLAGMGFLVCAGAVDDAVSLRPLTKASLETVAGLFLITGGGYRVVYLGWFAGLGNVEVANAFLSVLLTLFVLVATINAVNMIDGLDGLAGGTAVAALFWVVVAAHFSGMDRVQYEATLLLLCILAFLAFNARAPWRRAASVFLGDAGTMMLGFALVWFGLQLTQGADRIVSPWAYALVVALPLVDMASVSFRRLANGRSPFSADRRHLHHLLQRQNLRPGTISLSLVTVSAMLGGAGIVGSYLGWPNIVFVAILAFVVIAHTAAVFALGDGALLREAASTPLDAGRPLNVRWSQ